MKLEEIKATRYSNIRKAPVVKWISQLTSDQPLGVRVPPGVPIRNNIPFGGMFIIMLIVRL